MKLQLSLTTAAPKTQTGRETHMPMQVQMRPVARRLWLLTVFSAGLLLIGLTTSLHVTAQIQQFSSGSTGADGALNITAHGVTYLDPKAMKINPAGDNIF